MKSRDIISEIRHTVMDAIKEEYQQGYEAGKADIKKEIELTEKHWATKSKTGRWIEKRMYMECPNCHDVWHYEENQTERFK